MITDLEWGFAAQAAPAYEANGWYPATELSGHDLVRKIAETAAYCRELVCEDEPEGNGLVNFASTMHIRVQLENYDDSSPAITYLLDVTCDFDARSLI